MAVQAPAPARQLVPFRKATRQGMRPVGSIDYKSGTGGMGLKLTNVKLLAGIGVYVNGTMAITGTGTSSLTADGPWALIRRIRLVLNTGLEIFNLTGYGAFLVNHLLKESYNPAASGLSQLYSAPTAVANNAWRFFLWFPVSANDGLNFEVGLLNLQNERITANVVIDWGAEADAVNPGTNTVSFTGKADIYVEDYEIPNPNEAMLPPLNLVHRIVQQQDALLNKGPTPNRVRFLREGTLKQVIHVVRINGARDTANVDQLEIKLNDSIQTYVVPTPLQLFLQRMRYGQDLPTGVFVHDWWHAQMDVSQGDGRDFFDTRAIAVVDSNIYINANATFGTNNNFVDTIRRIVQVAQV